MKRLKWLLTGAVALSLAIVLLAGCGVSQADYDALQAENDDLTADLAIAQADLASLQGDYDALDADYQAASGELADIQGVYPPRYFDTYNELEDWVNEHYSLAQGAGVYKQHLDIQRMALEDGYIWSVAHYLCGSDFCVHGIALAGDSVYWVWLDGYIEWEDWR